MQMLETGAHVVRLVCPECGAAAAVGVDLSTVLTVTAEGATLKLRGKSKSVPHICESDSQDDLFSDDADADDLEDSQA